MDERQLDFEVAEMVMQSPKPSQPMPIWSSKPTDDTNCWMWLHRHPNPHWEPIHFSHSLEATRFMEDRIKELGLERQYAEALGEVIGNDNPKMLYIEPFALIHASAEQRCRAAVKVIKSTL